MRKIHILAAAAALIGILALPVWGGLPGSLTWSSLWNISGYACNVASFKATGECSDATLGTTLNSADASNGFYLQWDDCQSRCALLAGTVETVCVGVNAKNEPVLLDKAEDKQCETGLAFATNHPWLKLAGLIDDEGEQSTQTAADEGEQDESADDLDADTAEDADGIVDPESDWSWDWDALFDDDFDDQSLAAEVAAIVGDQDGVDDETGAPLDEQVYVDQSVDRELPEERLEDDPNASDQERLAGSIVEGLSRQMTQTGDFSIPAGEYARSSGLDSSSGLSGATGGADSRETKDSTDSASCVDRYPFGKTFTFTVESGGETLEYQTEKESKTDGGDFLTIDLKYEKGSGTSEVTYAWNMKLTESQVCTLETNPSAFSVTLNPGTTDQGIVKVKR